MLSLKHNFILYVTRENSTDLVGFEFLFLGLFTNGTFSWTGQYVPILIKEALHTDAGGVKLDSPAKPDGGCVIERYGELTSGSGSFLAAKETAEVFLRNFIVLPLSLRIVLAPKVSRYIFKSVLIL
jgi:hypothetical protein